MNIFNTHELHTSKWLTNENFVMCILLEKKELGNIMLSVNYTSIKNNGCMNLGKKYLQTIFQFF